MSGPPWGPCLTPQSTSQAGSLSGEALPSRKARARGRRGKKRWELYPKSIIPSP